MNIVECKDVTKSFRGKIALHRLTFSIREHTITGVIGRNGAGKTTLFHIIAGLLKPSSGDVRVFSKAPFNDLDVSANSIFIHERIPFPASMTLADVMEMMEMFYERWDQKLAKRLFDYFSFRSKQRHAELSKGMRSTFHAILGIASRAPLTIFDEPTTGMDVATRKDFYRALLKDYLAHPRTILLSSHHLNEIEDLLEDVLLIDAGKKVLHIPMIELKEMAIRLTGKAELVSRWTDGKEKLYAKDVGSERVVVVTNDFKEEEKSAMKLAGIKISAVKPHDVCVYLTNNGKGEIDDVFEND